MKPGNMRAGEGHQAPHKNIFAIGDAAVCNEHPLPTLGYAAKKQAHYLSNMFNK